MAIKMVREPSETPNINNIDDIVPMRYAYGNQDGYVIGKGTEISNTVNGLNFTVNSGRLVLQGVECDIDATGVTITIDNIATKRYYTVYLQVNLGLNTTSIKSEYDTATYPTIDSGDDLTENSTGIANLPLYQFTAQNGVVSDIKKVVESVKYAPNIFVDNSKKVNDLEIKKDENGVLKIGDIIIPQKKLLWSGDASATLNSSNYTNITIPNSNTLDLYGKKIQMDYKISESEFGLQVSTSAFVKFKNWDEAGNNIFYIPSSFAVLENKLVFSEIFTSFDSFNGLSIISAIREATFPFPTQNIIFKNGTIDIVAIYEIIE